MGAVGHKSLNDFEQQWMRAQEELIVNWQRLRALDPIEDIFQKLIFVVARRGRQKNIILEMQIERKCF